MEVEEPDYETLNGVGVVGNMIAGAAAGTAEHVVMYPVDSVKTRMQALRCEKKLAKGVLANVTNMIKDEGLLRPMRGATVVVTGSAPAHALYFTSYEQMKKVFAKKQYTYLPDTVVHGAAGTIATLFHDAIMTPAEAVKQRMQMCCSKYTRWTVCASNMYRQEGGRSFWRAYTTQLSMNIPFQVSQFIVYEKCKKILNPEAKYDPKSHLMSGAVAGAIAAAVTNPLDVCKTLLNTQEPQLLRELNTSRIVGMPAALSTVYRVAGLSGYFKGLSARVMFQAPSTAICWCTYEGFKHLLSLQPNLEDKYETLTDLTTAASPVVGSSSGSSSSSTTAAMSTPATSDDKKGDNRLWEKITDLPRPLHALEALKNSEETTPLKYSEPKFPSISRTE